MNHKPRTLLVLAFLSTLGPHLSTAFAQGTAFTYQGRLASGANVANGIYDLRFTLFDSSGGPTVIAGPLTNSSTAISNGLFTVTLDPGAGVFTGADRWLEIGVRTNGGGAFTALSPRQKITATPYSITAGNVPDGSITSAKLAPGAIGSAQLAPSVDLGTASISGRLDIFRTAAGTPAITLDGAASVISTYGSDGLEQIRLHGTSYGELLLRNSLANNATAVNLTAQGSTGGRLTLNNTNGSSRAILEGENTGGTLTLYTADGNTGAILYGNEGSGSGSLSLRNTNGSARFRAYGGPSSGRMLAYNTDGYETVDIDAEPAGIVTVRNATGGTRAYMYAGGTQGGEIRNYEEDGTLTTIIQNVSDAGVVGVRNAVGAETVYLWGTDSGSTGGGQIGLKEGDGTETLTLQAAEVAGNGAQIILRKSDGTASITLDADQGGDGRVTTEVLTITGGADLSENFNINEAEAKPGMIVSIDPKQPGELLLSREAYDHKVAGIVSGAGGVRPGMLMGQAGTKADGKHPIALTGRVYCWVDAGHGAIQPGDMITSSPTPGHGMKAADRERAFGSIIGKAMTGLDQGKGLVLVLVSLQ